MSQRQQTKLGAFLKSKIAEKGWGINEFTKELNLEKNFSSALFSGNRDFIPENELLKKIFSNMEFSETEIEYTMDLINKERETGKPI